MDNSTTVKKGLLWKCKIIIAVVSILVIAAAMTIILIVRNNKNNEAIQTYAYQEFDPDAASGKGSDIGSTALSEFSDEEIEQLKSELSEAHSALEDANAAYETEINARVVDQKALEDAQGKVIELESEKNRLIAELDAKEVDLKLKTPPELDFKKITGMYEGYGELVTLTYSYEVTVETKSIGNIFTNKTLLYSIPGTLKIGVNFDKVKNGITTNNVMKTVTVTIPSAYFVSNEIDESNVQRFDVNRGIFSKVEDKDYLNVAQNAKDKAEEQVRDNGMLEYSQRLAGLEFIGLLEPITSKSGYQIVVVYE